MLAYDKVETVMEIGCGYLNLCKDYFWHLWTSCLEKGRAKISQNPSNPLFSAMNDCVKISSRLVEKCFFIGSINVFYTLWSIYSNSSHIWRMTGLSDSIWKVGFQTKIKATFGKYWSSVFREEDIWISLHNLPILMAKSQMTV